MDLVCHVQSEAEVIALKAELNHRFGQCKLQLHPTKTKIIYCKDEDRTKDYPNITFDFLGYTFRTRLSKNRYGKYFANFTPAMSDKAAKRVRIDNRLMLWAMHKFKRLKGKSQKAKAWLSEVRERDPYLFVHWERMGRVDQ